MSKKRFVQAVIARSLPAKDKRQAALKYAEDLWAWLTIQGYGDDKPSRPRDGKDWYNALDARQRKWFEGFWQAFGHKRGRENAAMRWQQLGVKTDAEYQQIIDAASAEARRELAPGQVRKMAEGWLNEKRYLDFAPTTQAIKNQQNHVLSRLLGELNGIKKLYEQSGDDALLPQIEKLENAIKAARQPKQV